MATYPLNHEFRVPGPAKDAHRIMTREARGLEARGYHLASDANTRAEYERESWPTWVIVLCIVTFPLGLLSLLTGKQRERVVFDFSQATDHDGSIVFVSGHASRSTCKAIWKL